MSSSFGIVVS